MASSKDVTSPRATKLYKLTDKDGYTRRGEYNECLWGPDVSHSGTGKGDLCGPGWIHAYTSPYLAVLLNPIHANLSPCRLWEAEGVVERSDKGLKVGCKTLRTVKEIKLPVFTTNQKIYFALMCAKAVHEDSGFASFVNDWISGKGRSAEAASRAAEAARAASAAASAARAASAAASAASAAASAARAASAAASAAAEAASAAASAADGFDLNEIAKQAFEWKDPIDV